MVDRRLWRTRDQSAKRPLSLISRKVAGGSSVVRNAKTTTVSLALAGSGRGAPRLPSLSDDAGAAHTPINEHPVAGTHLPHGARRLPVTHTILSPSWPGGSSYGVFAAARHYSTGWRSDGIRYRGHSYLAGEVDISHFALDISPIRLRYCCSAR